MRLTLTSLVIALVCQYAIAAPVALHQDAMSTEPWTYFPRTNNVPSQADRPHRSDHRHREPPTSTSASALLPRPKSDTAHLLIPLSRRATLIEEEKQRPGLKIVAALLVPDGTRLIAAREFFEDEGADIQDARWRPGKWSYIGGGLGAAAVGFTAQQLLKKIIDGQKKQKKEAEANGGQGDTTRSNSGKGGAAKSDPSEPTGKPGRQNRRDLSIEDDEDGELYTRQHRWRNKKKLLWIGGGLAATALGFTGGVVLKNVLQKWKDKESDAEKSKQPSQEPDAKPPAEPADDTRAGRHNRRDVSAVGAPEEEEVLESRLGGIAVARTALGNALRQSSRARKVALGLTLTASAAATAGLGAIGWKLHRNAKKAKEAKQRQKEQAPAAAPVPPPGQP